MMIVVVLDMDETVGSFDGKTFLIRPKLTFFINFLRMCGAEIVLWSLGGDEYVKWVVNNFLEDVKQHAFKIFALTQCERSNRKFSFYKHSDHIRNMYGGEKIYLIGVDDKASRNMDSRYDLRIAPKPYTKHDPSDRELVNVMEIIIDAYVKLITESKNT